MQNKSVGNIILNIPVVPLSVVRATFELSPGVYTWQCEVPRGSDPTGWGEAMEVLAWMTGTLTAD